MTKEKIQNLMALKLGNEQKFAKQIQATVFSLSILMKKPSFSKTSVC